MQNLEECIQKDFLKKEMVALEEAFYHRFYIEKVEEHLNVTYDEAQIHFMEKFLNSYAEGYRYCYCQNVCEHRDYCNVGKRFLHYYKNRMKSD